MPANKTVCCNIFIFSFLLFSLTTCLKKNCKKHGTCPQEYHKFTLGGARDYLWAESGSYWIYKNTQTGDLDTQTCAGIRLDTIVTKGSEDYSKHITIEYEKLSRTIESSFNDWWESNRTAAFTADANDPTYYRIVLTRYSPIGLTASFFYPFDIGTYSGTGSSYTSFIGMDSIVKMHGKTYTNVAKFSVDRDEVWDNRLNCTHSNNIYYWAENVGLIKKEMKSCNSSWELIEYKVIK